jgi:hypothetical protein
MKVTVNWDVGGCAMRRIDHRARRRPHDWKQASTTAFVVVGIAWLAAPQMNSLWTTTTSSPEEVARIETSVHYSNCDEARDAGVAPIYRGEPGYREGMDGDADGVACEPYRGR